MKELTIKKFKNFDEMEDFNSESIKNMTFEERWNLTFELIDNWCDLRQIPQELRRIDRSIAVKIKAPWVK